MSDERRIQNDQQRLKRLAGFSQVFRDPRTVFWQWHAISGQGTSENPYSFPWFDLQSPIIDDGSGERDRAHVAGHGEPEKGSAPVLGYSAGVVGSSITWSLRSS